MYKFILLFLLMFYLMKLNIFNFILNFKFMNFSKKMMNFSILKDFFSSCFFSCLLIMSGLMLIFAKEYMKKNLLYKRFFMLVYLFIFSMCLLIFFPQLMFLIFGWDGLGFTSVFLIFFYSCYSSWGASLKTFFFNRFGDCFLMLSIVMYSFVESKFLKLINNYFILMILVLCAFTKSAQYPFSSWLPAAMAAPTPVSALVHSSTLVTAGVYIIFRFNYFLKFYFKNILIIFGLWTLGLASLSGILDLDKKKMVAFSTLSQLGLMMYGLGLGLSNFVFFHLIIHAFIKALIFLCVGVLMFSMFHFQDLRCLKKVKFSNKMMKFKLLWSNFMLSGFPFGVIFFSKENFMEKMQNLNKMVLKIFMFMLMFFTLLYSVRLIILLFNYSFFNYFNLSMKKVQSSFCTWILFFMVKLFSSLFLINLCFFNYKFYFSKMFYWLLFFFYLKIIYLFFLKINNNFFFLMGYLKNIMSSNFIKMMKINGWMMFKLFDKGFVMLMLKFFPMKLFNNIFLLKKYYKFKMFFFGSVFLVIFFILWMMKF